MNRSKGTNGISRGGFETRTQRVAQGNRCKPEKHHDAQESMSFPSGFRPHRGPTQVRKGRSQENGCLAEELRPSFPVLGGRAGAQDTQERPGRCRQEMRDVPGCHCKAQPEAILNLARRGTSSFHSLQRQGGVGSEACRGGPADSGRTSSWKCRPYSWYLNRFC